MLRKADYIGMVIGGLTGAGLTIYDTLHHNQYYQPPYDVNEIAMAAVSYIPLGLLIGLGIARGIVAGTGRTRQILRKIGSRE